MSGDQDWLRLQKIIFGKYVQQKLREGGIKREIKQIVDDLKDPLLLIDLLEVLSGQKIAKRPKKAKMRIQEVAAMSEALDFVKSVGVDLGKIRASPEDLVDGKEKISLALVFQVIIKFIKFEEDEESAALDVRTALELWLKNKTQGYDNVSIGSFKKPTWIKSFHDGLAFNALIHRMRPNLVDYKSLSGENKDANLEQALNLGEKYLNIEKYIQASDVAKLDETAMIVYLSDWFTGVQLLQKQDIAARRIGKLVDMTILHDKMRADYTQQATEIKAWLDKSIQYLNDRPFDDTWAGVKKLLEDFYAFKKGEKSENIVKQMDATELFNNLQLRLSNHSRPVWNPADGLSPSALDEEFKKLAEAESKRSQDLFKEMARQNMLQKVFRRFNATNTKLTKWVGEHDAYLKTEEEINSVDEAEEALDALTLVDGEIKQMTSAGLSDLNKMAQKLLEERYEKKDEVKATQDAQTQAFAGLEAGAKAKREKLDAALAQQKKIDDDLYKGYAETIKNFEALMKDKNDKLHDTSGELEAQLEISTGLGGDQKDVQETIAAVVAADAKLEERKLVNNPYTTVTAGDAQATADQFQILVAKKIALLKEQVAEKKRGGLSEEQVKEINDNFDFFDKDKSNSLTKRELRTCLQSLGEESTPKDVQKILDKYDTEKKGSLSRTDFIEFMKDNAGDTDSSEEIIRSFKYLSYDKEHILDEELSNLINERTWTQNHVEYLKKEMAAKDAGKDYGTWTTAVFAR